MLASASDVGEANDRGERRSSHELALEAWRKVKRVGLQEVARKRRLGLCPGAEGAPSEFVEQLENAASPEAGLSGSSEKSRRSLKDGSDPKRKRKSFPKTAAAGTTMRSSSKTILVATAESATQSSTCCDQESGSAEHEGSTEAASGDEVHEVARKTWGKVRNSFNACRRLALGVDGGGQKDALNALKVQQLWYKHENSTNRFRNFVARRTLYSMAKTYLEDVHNAWDADEGHHSIAEVFQAVAVASRQVLLMGRVCDACMALVVENRIKTKMSKMTRTLCVGEEHHWKTFVTGLVEIRQDISAAIHAHRDLVDLGGSETQINAIIEMVEVQDKANDSLQKRMDILSTEYHRMVENARSTANPQSRRESKAHQASKQFMADRAMSALWAAKSEAEITERSMQDLQQAISILGRCVCTDMEWGTNSIDVESCDNVQHDEEILADVPEKVMQQMLDSFLQSGPEDVESLNKCRMLLSIIGASEVEIKSIQNAVRRTAWRTNVAKTMTMIKTQNQDSLDDLHGLIAEAEPKLKELIGPAASRDVLGQRRSWTRKAQYGSIKDLFKKKSVGKINIADVKGKIARSRRLSKHHRRASDFGKDWLQGVRSQIRSVNEVQGCCCTSEEEHQAKCADPLYIKDDKIRESLITHLQHEQDQGGACTPLLEPIADGDSGFGDSDTEKPNEPLTPGAAFTSYKSCRSLANERSISHKESEQLASRANSLQIASTALSRRGSMLIFSREPSKAGKEDSDDSEEDWGRNLVKSALQSSVKELLQTMRTKWQSVKKASEALARGTVHKQISLHHLHEELQGTAVGKNIGLDRLCVLFQSLGASCSAEHMCITVDECRRIARYRMWYNSNADLTANAEALYNKLGVRDALFASMTVEDKLLMQVYVAASKFYRAGDSNNLTAGVELHGALAACWQALCDWLGDFVVCLMSSAGLRVFLDLIALHNVPIEYRYLAVNMVSDGIVCRGGASYKSKARCQEQAELLKNHGDSQPPANFDFFLATHIWKPVLDIIDPEGLGPPPSLDPKLVQSLLALLCQARIPAMALGKRIASLASDMCENLMHLYMSALSAEELLNALKAFELLEKSHDSREGGTMAEVHTLAAALGGCRFLREQLARLHGVPGGSESEFVIKGDRMLRLWRGARQKLFSRHQVLQQQHTAEGSRFEKVKQALVESEAAGFMAPVVSNMEAATVSASAHEDKSPNRSNIPNRSERFLVSTEGQMQKVQKGYESGKLEKRALGANPRFEEGSMEAELLQRLNNRWTQEKARQKFEAEFYDWSLPETLPLAEALRASAAYMSRQGMVPPLLIPPRTPKSARGRKPAPLPLPCDYTARPQTVGTAVSKADSRPLSVHSPRLPTPRARTAGESFRFNTGDALPFKIPNDTWPSQSSRPTTSAVTGSRPSTQVRARRLILNN